MLGHIIHDAGPISIDEIIDQKRNIFFKLSEGFFIIRDSLFKEYKTDLDFVMNEISELNVNITAPVDLNIEVFVKSMQIEIAVLVFDRQVYFEIQPRATEKDKCLPGNNLGRSSDEGVLFLRSLFLLFCFRHIDHH